MLDHAIAMGCFVRKLSTLQCHYGRNQLKSKIMLFNYAIGLTLNLLD